MSTADTRRKFIYDITGIFFKIFDCNEDVEVSRFLNTHHCTLLCAYQRNVGELLFSDSIPQFSAENDTGVVVFMKLKQCALTDESMTDNIQVTYLKGKPSTAFYHALKLFFVPLMNKGVQEMTITRSALLEQMNNLEKLLKSDMIIQESRRLSASESKSDLSFIFNLDSEIDYWQTVSKSGKRSATRHSGSKFKEVLTPLADELRTMSTMEFTDVEDTLENAHNILDDLWRLERYLYPQNRMQHLLSIISIEIMKYIDSQLKNLDIWMADFATISNTLDSSISLCKKWRDHCDHLTRLFWPNYAQHVWTGDAFQAPNLIDFESRLEEILNLRMTQHQLTKLLTPKEQDEVNCTSMFEPFKDLYVIQSNPYFNPDWALAKTKFEHLIQPAEEKVAYKLRKQLASIDNSNARQYLHEFSRNNELINRATVKQILKSEREQLLVTLNDYVQHLMKNQQSIMELSGYNMMNTPLSVREVVAVRQIQSRIKEIMLVGQKLLSDLENYPSFITTLESFSNELKIQHSEMYDSWLRQTTKNIESESIILKEDGPVVQFSKNKLMSVNYSPKLAILIQEVRQFGSYGYKIPTKISEVADHAKKFVTYAKVLEQVATFHNTIGDRMITSQRPMMLAGALELAKLVQEESTVTWSNTEKIERYIKSLRTAVERLSRENNQLTAFHHQLGEIVKEFKNIDLLRQQNKWKEGVNKMREVIKQAERMGFKNMQPWKTFWDNKLAEALRYQYELGLEEVHHYLPDIRADLVFRGGRVQFNPPLEELRVQYYSSLKRYLSIPYVFKGLSDDGAPRSMFTDIVDKNTHLFIPVYEKAEDQIVKLEGIIEQWIPWLALGAINVDEMCENNLKTWQDWDTNFRESKSFGQQIAKLTSWEERVGYFVISLTVIRTDMEAQNRRYWSALVTSLQSSIVRDVTLLERFIFNVHSNLTKQPRSPDEIAELQSCHADIMNQTNEMTNLYEDVQSRSKTLSSWCRERIESVSRLQESWDNLQSLMSNHKDLMAKQIETIKLNLSSAAKVLEDEANKWFVRWEELRPSKVQSVGYDDLVKKLNVFKTQMESWKGFLEQKEKIKNDFIRFHMDDLSLESFDGIQRNIEKEQNAWGIVEDFHSQLQSFADEEWIMFRKQIHKFEEFLNDWTALLLDEDGYSLNSVNKTEYLDHSFSYRTILLQELQKYKDAIPSFKHLRGNDFDDRHWMEVFTMLNIPPRNIDAINFGMFLNVADILADNEIIKELQALNKRAASEIIVHQALAELDLWEIKTKFILTPHVDSHGSTVMLVKDFKDILNNLGESQCLLQSVKSSSNFDTLSERGQLWETKLSDMDVYLNNLCHIQQKWVYLEPIFNQGTLKQEQVRFQRIDKEFRIILNEIAKDLRVCSLLKIYNLKTTLEIVREQISRCQNSLNNYLKDKREKFPRFLFLGDDDLLQILGQSHQESVIQRHLKKLFSGIDNVSIVTNDGKSAITAMVSQQGEIVDLCNPVIIEKPVEEWLNELVTEMRVTLKKLLADCLSLNTSKTSGADPLMFPSQILNLAFSIDFTKHTESAIKMGSLKKYLAELQEQSDYYSNMNFSNTESAAFKNKVLELKLKSLLMDNIHQINILKELIENNVTSILDWHWYKQVRYYYENKITIVRMACGEFDYSFEYLGNPPKLVHTPLTDKCYLTLTQGMHLGLGGNPYGPAGTGKTETIKALGGILGRQVLVFNCDDGIDSKSMALILMGLAKCGSWGCFDEFNRLDERTLSAVSTDIQNIQTALVTKSESIKINETVANIDPHCGIFVTMNPAGVGYGARNRLPDNLKQLFRPVAMSVPDNLNIAEVLLFVDGYRHSKLIASKLCELFSLSSLLLSKQQHYDWGLRALKTVINSCGERLRRSKVDHSLAVNKSSIELEFQSVINSVRLNTLSKLTHEDRVYFDGLIKDIFPNSLLSDEIDSQDALKLALRSSCEELGLEINEKQLRKCLELNEQLNQRMGVIIVGPSGTGKTVIRNILLNALAKMNQKIKECVLNPKSMSRSKLFGSIDPITRQWNDGVLTVKAFEASAEPSDVRTWIVCDGDIDPEWIEALNSVLDDNRLLTLPSGWRIQLQPNVNFIFETQSVTHASPATISRMGITYLSEKTFSNDDVIQSWLKMRSDDLKMEIGRLVDTYFNKAFDWVKFEGQLSVPMSDVAIIKTTLSYLETSTIFTSKSSFLSALIATMGGLLLHSSRKTFVKTVFEIFDEFTDHPEDMMYCRYIESSGQITTYVPEISEIDDECHDNRSMTLFLTSNVQHCLNTLKVWFNNTHFLLVGPHGSAKNLVIQTLLKDSHDSELIRISCSPHQNPKIVLDKLLQNCIIVNRNRGGRAFRPKKKHLILHFQNVHQLAFDKWGTNMLIAFLQQFITYEGVFSEELEWIGMENVTIIGTLQATDILPERFTSLFKVYTIESPTNSEIMNIYQPLILNTISKCAGKNFDNRVLDGKSNKIVAFMLGVFNEFRDQFTEVSQCHYMFSSHDLTAWCLNLSRYRNVLMPEEWDGNLLEVILNEAKRIFSDKLVNSNERERFYSILRNNLAKTWNSSANIPLGDNSFFVISDKTSSNISESLFEKLDAESWMSIVNKALINYENENNQPIKLPLFKESIKLVDKILRVTTTPGNSLVLIGKSGCGRKTAVKLATNIVGAPLFIFNSTNIQQFKMDIKSALQLAGIERRPVYALIENYLISDKNIQDILHSLITSGQITDLYSHSEIDNIVSSIKKEFEQDGFQGSLIEYYYSRIRENLHVILLVDIKFAPIFKNNPQLILGHPLVWIEDWSKSSMNELPSLLHQRNKSRHFNDLDNDEIVEIPNNFYEIHETAYDNLQTPIRYSSFVYTYFELYRKKKLEISQKCEKLKAGVSKLTEARQIVATLKMKATEQKKQLIEKQGKANGALEMIAATMKNAHSHKGELQELKTKTEQENKLMEERKKQIETELADVEPLIQEARAAVGNIKSESLSEIRSLRAPPDVIRDILEGVLRLMGILDTSWNSMKTFLAKRGIKEEIRSFDADNITKENRIAVEKLISQRKDSFDEKTAKRASMAAAPLAVWVIANVRYANVYEKVKPLSREQQNLQDNLKLAGQQIQQLSSGLTDVDQTVAELKKQLSVYSREAAENEISLRDAENILNSAQTLVSKLQGEYDRWQKQLNYLTSELKYLSSKSMIAAAFINYLGNETEIQRRVLNQRWMEINKTESNTFEIGSFLSSESQKLQWISEKLPSDQVSIENVIIILNSWLFPLLIDPSSIAFNWLKTHYQSSNRLEIITQHSEKFQSTLELSLRFGKILIISEIDSIPSVIYGILRRQFIEQGERRMIQINGRLIDFNPDFKLFLISRNPHLDVPNEISSYLNMINFTITASELTNQLITCAVQQENPELETKRLALLEKREELQNNLDELEDKLLLQLGSSNSDLLNNKELLASLNETKEKSSKIQDGLHESIGIQRKLDDEYNVFKNVAEFSSRLYFSCLEMRRVNLFYQISIDEFKKLFLKIINYLRTNNSLHESIETNKRTILQLVFTHLVRGIFKKDRLTFAFHLINHMYKSEIPDVQWQFFMGSFTNTLDSTKISIPKFIPKERENDVRALQVTLPDLYSNLKLDDDLWKNFMDHPECEINFPQLSSQLTMFEQLLVLKCLRPDRLLSGMMRCGQLWMGVKSINGVVVNLENLYNGSNCDDPLLIISSGGADPSKELYDLAINVVGENKYLSISMGNGEESTTLKQLKYAAENGMWICLKNLHLVTEGLPFFIQNIRQLKPHDEFRLWLTTEPVENFSTVLIQWSRKITYESPQGIKKNLQRIYETWVNDEKTNVQRMKPRSGNENKILFSLAALHAVIQERRIYIPQGWLKYYEFSENDLFAAKKLILNVLSKPQMGYNSNFIWIIIRGLCSHAIYGGKIENFLDQQILESYMRQYFNESILSYTWKPFGSETIPTSEKLKDYLNVIGKLSNLDLPSYFGLPSNINSILELNTASGILNQLKGLEISSQSTVNFDVNLWKEKIPAVLTTWKKLNNNRDWLAKSKIALSDKEDESTIDNVSPLNHFIHQEYKFMLKLLNGIHKNLINANKILKGSTTPNDEYLLFGNELIKNQTPTKWIEIWSGPNDAIEYLQAIAKRASAVSALFERNISDFIKQPIDLTQFFYPKQFFMALKQQTSRTLNITPDELSLTCHWSNNLSNAESLAVVLKNLKLEGALIQHQALQPCDFSSSSFSSISELTIQWTVKEPSLQSNDFLTIPLYFTPKRDCLLTQLQISLGDSTDKWLQASVAIYLDQ